MATRLPEQRPRSGHGEWPVHVGPLRRRHLRSVLRIEQQVYPRPWTMGLFLSELSQQASRSYLVARRGGAVVGYCGLMFAPDEAHVTTIAVDPTHRRQSVAIRMMLVQMRIALARETDAMTLEVRQSNDEAQHLYARLGFVPVGVRRGYYQETGEDALVMWLHDLGGSEHRLRMIDVSTGLAEPTALDPALVARFHSALSEGPAGTIMGEAGDALGDTPHGVPFDETNGDTVEQP